MTDLLLLHPPAIYDFRKLNILTGPISDVIPSSSIFDMYPVGFVSIADYLRRRGMDVRIVNLASRMLGSREFDAVGLLSRMKARAVGIDLHWLPHVQGALAVAKMVRDCHPETP